MEELVVILSNSFITNNQVPSSTFNFRKKDYPGVEVIDLR